MKMILKDTRAKAQRRKEIQMSKVQTFFAPLRLCASICLLFFAIGARAETTNDLSDAEIQGRQLAQKLCDAQPTENFTNSGFLKIHRMKGDWTNYPIKCEVIITPTNWQSIYEASGIARFVVIHTTSQLNKYFYYPLIGDGPIPPSLFQSESRSNGLARTDLSFPFNGSDFWLGDLGLEFFHWPQQKILPKTTNLKRSRDYTLLESTDPNPTTNGYSRVVSWIDKESGGILEADAYDAKGKLLKVFTPNSFKKVNGQYQVSEMEIDNVQTGSRTRLTFDLKN